MAEVIKRYDTGAGIDLRSSDLGGDPNSASSLRNATYVNQSTLTVRKGYEHLIPNQPSYGMFKFERYNEATNTSTEELVFVSDRLWRVRTGSLTITYAPQGLGSGYYGSYFGSLWGSTYFGGSGSGVSSVGSGADYFPGYFGTLFAGDYWVGGESSSYEPVEAFPFPSASLLVEDEQFVFKLYVDDEGVLSLGLGKGFDETIVTIQDLIDAIEAVQDFTVECDPELLSLPAAFVPVFADTAFEDQTSLALTVYYQEEVPYPSSSEAQFGFLNSNASEEGFELATAVNLSDSLYIASGFDELIKYDSQKAYRVGLPGASAPTVAATGSGTVGGTNIRYAVQYVQVDANGYEHRGAISTSSGLVSPGGTQNVNVTIPRIEATLGYNTDMAVIAAAPPTQTGTTFSCASNTLKVGDTLYFIDNSGVRYDARTVTASSAGSLTISGDSLTLGASTVISANLRVRLYRQAVTDGEFFLVEDWPHDSRASFTVTDTFSALGAQYSAPFYLDSLPPSGLRYLVEFQGLLFGAVGDTVYYSNPGNPEGWTALRSFDVVGGGPITALAVTKEALIVFKAKSIHAVTGAINEGIYSVERVSKDLGCVSHHAIQDISGVKDISGTIVFPSSRGVYAISGKSIAGNIGQQIVPLFTDKSLDQNTRLVFKRSVSAHDSEKQDYMLFIPAESVSNGKRYANSSSKVLVYNYYRKHWLLWDNLNWAGGAAIVDGELWTAERTFSSYTGELATKKAKRLDRGYWIDYADHNLAQEWEYVAGWEAMEEPTKHKKFTRFKLYSNDSSIIGNFAVRIATERDFIPGLYESDFTFDFGSTAASEGGWGNGPWGSFPWGDPSVPWQSTRLKGSKAVALRVSFFHNQLYRQPIITGWDLQIHADYQLRITK